MPPLANLSFPQLMGTIWTTPSHFYRPLTMSLMAGVARMAGDPELAWRLLRWISILLLLTSYGFFVAAIRRLLDEEGKRLEASVGSWALPLCCFFSAGVLIAGGWFAVLFDVVALTLICAATLLLAGGRRLVPGLLLGIAWFLKEIAVLGIVVILLFAFREGRGRGSWRSMVIPAGTWLAAGLVYFSIRTALIPFGSARDIHGFDPRMFWPTIVAFADSFWVQTTLRAGPSILLLILFMIPLLALRHRYAVGLYLLTFLLASGAYWGQFGYNATKLVTPEVFNGRFFLIPATLALLLLMTAGRRAVLLVLLPFIVGGGLHTSARYRDLQKAYARIYQAAVVSRGFYCVDFPPRPFLDPSRNLVMGDLPDCPRRLDGVTGEVVTVEKHPAAP